MTKKLYGNISNKRYCWVAKQDKIGWRLSLCIGESKPFNIPGLRVVRQRDIKTLLNANMVYIHKNENK